MENFDDFYTKIKNSLSFWIIVLIVCAFFGTLFFWGYRSDKVDEHRFYDALQGIQVNDEDATKAAPFALKILDPNTNSTETIKNIIELNSINSDYSGYLLDKDKNPQIVKLIHGEIQSSDQIVKVPLWKNFFLLFLISAVIFLNLCVNIYFIYKSIDDRESTLEWPWKQVWPFFVILFLSPIIILTMVIELIIKAIRRRTSPQSRDENLPTPENQSEFTPENYEKIKIEYQDFIENLAKKNSETQKLYLDFFSNTIKSRKTDLQNLLPELRTNINEIGQELKEAQIAFARANSELNEINNNYEQYKDRKDAQFIRDYNYLVNHPHVKAIKIEGNILSVYTDTIFVDWESSTYELGIFVIGINMLRKQVDRVENLCTSCQSGYGHPYSTSRTTFCFGHLSSTIGTAIEAMEFGAAIQHIITALRSVDGDSTRKNLDLWKKVKP